MESCLLKTRYGILRIPSRLQTSRPRAYIYRSAVPQIYHKFLHSRIPQTSRLYPDAPKDFDQDHFGEPFTLSNATMCERINKIYLCGHEYSRKKGCTRRRCSGTRRYTETGSRICYQCEKRQNAARDAQLRAQLNAEEVAGYYRKSRTRTRTRTWYR